MTQGSPWAPPRPKPSTQPGDRSLGCVLPILLLQPGTVGAQSTPGVDAPFINNQPKVFQPLRSAGSRTPRHASEQRRVPSQLTARTAMGFFQQDPSTENPERRLGSLSTSSDISLSQSQLMAQPVAPGLPRTVRGCHSTTAGDTNPPGLCEACRHLEDAKSPFSPSLELQHRTWPTTPYPAPGPCHSPPTSSAGCPPPGSTEGVAGCPGCH